MTNWLASLRAWWAAFNRVTESEAGQRPVALPFSLATYPVKHWQRTHIVSELRASTPRALFTINDVDYEKNSFIERSVHQLFEAADTVCAQVGPWQFSEWADHASYRPTLRWQVWAPVCEQVAPKHVEAVLSCLEQAAREKRNINEVVLQEFGDVEEDAVV